jgi:hypothetical protein
MKGLLAHFQQPRIQHCAIQRALFAARLPNKWLPSPVNQKLDSLEV